MWLWVTSPSSQRTLGLAQRLPSPAAAALHVLCGDQEAVGYDGSWSKRVTCLRWLRGCSNSLQREELCFRCLLVWSVTQQQDLSLLSCVHRRGESKAQTCDQLGK